MTLQVRSHNEHPIDIIAQGRLIGLSIGLYLIQASLKEDKEEKVEKEDKEKKRE